MLITIKLTTLAFDYYDGTRLLLGDEKLTPHQKKMNVVSFPSFIEFWGYIYHYNGFMAGPIFNFKEYREYTNMQMFQSVSISSLDSIIILHHDRVIFRSPSVFHSHPI